MTLACKLLDCRKGMTWADVVNAYRELFGDETPHGVFLVFVPGTWVSVRREI